ncbi:MAG: DoxX family protein [Rhodobiaceae bacterium]|nr:DoxX family protein [Rhodobiaceae bacterium]
MFSKILGDVPSDVESARADMIALVLRLGLGSVFVIGGWWKLSRALSVDHADALVGRYIASDGYINTFFQDYLFTGDVGDVLTPLGFLMLLSAFELISGLALMAGLFVRALSFSYAFLMWSFVVALPVVTASGYPGDLTSHFSPALLVQIRDVGLSGMFLVLLHLGSGSGSLDGKLFARGNARPQVNWDNYGLLLRLSVAAVFLVGGFFAGYGHIKSFVPIPILLVLVGGLLASGHLVRPAAFAAFLIVAWYCFGKFHLDVTVWNNLNAVKRELAYLAATAVLFAVGGGNAFRPSVLVRAPQEALLGPKNT